eukprot:13629333-Alexandrium_andersonii.AAC.1
MDGLTGLAPNAARRSAWGGPSAAGASRLCSTAGAIGLSLARPVSSAACCRCGVGGPPRGIY